MSGSFPTFIVGVVGLVHPTKTITSAARMRRLNFFLCSLVWRKKKPAKGALGFGGG